MSFLVISRIVNFERNAVVAEMFERLLEDYKRRVELVTVSFIPTGDLRKVYVQFQFDAGGALNATRGIKIGRYSAKHQHLEGTAEVTRESFENTDARTGTALLASLLIEVLRKMAKTLSGKVPNNISDLVIAIQKDTDS